MAESYAVRFEITPSVMTDAIRLFQAAFMARYRIFLGLIVIVGVVVAFDVDRGTGLPLSITGLALLAMTRMEFFDRWLYAKQARGVVGGTVEYLINDAGIHFQNPLASGDIAWAGLTSVSTNNRTTVFGRDRVMAAYIPATAFASTRERDSFVAFSQGHVGTPAAQL